jgi:PAS domain S-box-containing protein
MGEEYSRVSLAKRALVDKPIDGTEFEAVESDLSAAIIGVSFEAIVSKTLEGTVTSWNPAATTLFGYRPEEMIGRAVRRLIPAGRQAEEDLILKRINVGEHVEPYETVRLHKNGRFVDVLVTISPSGIPQEK